MVDALKRASARRITAVILLLATRARTAGLRSRAPISAKVVANMLEAVGVERLLTMDPHADHRSRAFQHPGRQHLRLAGSWAERTGRARATPIRRHLAGRRRRGRARALATAGCDLAIIDKRRPKANVSEVMHVIGEIENCNCVIMDDMIDTAGTLVKRPRCSRSAAPSACSPHCTHPVFWARPSSASAARRSTRSSSLTLSRSARRRGCCSRSASCRSPSCSPRPSAGFPTGSR